MRRWLRPLFGCSHRETIIERRTLAGTTIGVKHVVCMDCGHAAPLIRRSAEEHAKIVAAGTPKVPTARKG